MAEGNGVFFLIVQELGISDTLFYAIPGKSLRTLQIKDASLVKFSILYSSLNKVLGSLVFQM